MAYHHTLLGQMMQLSLRFEFQKVSPKKNFFFSFCPLFRLLRIRIRTFGCQMNDRGFDFSAHPVPIQSEAHHHRTELIELMECCK